MKVNVNYKISFYFSKVALTSRCIDLAAMLALADGETDWQAVGKGWQWKRLAMVYLIIPFLCFPQPSNTEQFHQRGQGFNASSGRYTAPVSGFYQLTASLLLGMWFRYVLGHVPAPNIQTSYQPICF